MFLCEISYLPSAKQVIFFKFVTTYYKKYLETKSEKKTKIEENLIEKANSQDLLNPLKEL